VIDRRKPTRPGKILLCHNEYTQTGGEDLVFAEERRLLEAHGHEVVPYTRHNDDIQDIAPISLAARTFWNHETYRALRKLIRRERPALIHCANTFPLVSPAAYYAAHAEGIPVIQTLHNFRLLCAAATLSRKNSVCEDCVGSFAPWRGVTRGCYPRGRAAGAALVGMLAAHKAIGTWKREIDTYIALTEFSRELFIRGGLPEAKIRVKPNFVETDPGLGSGAGGYTVFVGRLSSEKGIDTLLDAWSRLRSDTELVIIGDGPMADQVRCAASQDPRIRLYGWRKASEVLDIVGDAAVLVVPSIWYETFGRVIVEAYAKGTPVIASNHGAMAELVEDGRTGSLFQPGSPEALARAIAQFYSNPDAQPGMRDAARARYLAKFTAATNYEILRSIYDEALDRHQMERPAPDRRRPLAMVDPEALPSS